MCPFGYIPLRVTRLDTHNSFLSGAVPALTLLFQGHDEGGKIGSDHLNSIREWLQSGVPERSVGQLAVDHHQANETQTKEFV